MSFGGGLKALNIFINSSLVGLALDGLFLIYDPLKHNRYLILIIWGGLAALPHNLTGWFRDILTGIDIWVVLTMNVPKMLSGLLFAAVGAALSGQLIKILKRQYPLATDIKNADP
ncbi:MAG: hypothetical protein LBJ61_10615 [Deltaproteobacteria bacterium]|nr:hypothetical protein [Deltaproteobacteria bacterium]